MPSPSGITLTNAQARLILQSFQAPVGRCGALLHDGRAGPITKLDTCPYESTEGRSVVTIGGENWSISMSDQDGYAYLEEDGTVFPCYSHGDLRLSPAGGPSFD